MGSKVASAVSTAVSVADTVVNYESNKKKAKKEKQALETENKIREEQIKARTEQVNKDKINLLKAKTATQRAKLSANGLDVTSGSSAAYMGNLKKQVDEEIADNEYLADLSLQSEDVSYNYKRDMNSLNSSKATYDGVSDAFKKTANLSASLVDAWKS